MNQMIEQGRISRDDLLAQAARVIPSGASQATTVEQTRAVAQVQAALIVAHGRPRAPFEALARAKQACEQMALAERAFFKFARGGQTVEGPSIHLATELARCWGNMQHSIVELDRDDDRGVSEMVAMAWDLETNTMATVGFLVPHFRDTKSGPRRLTDQRDIYENNANAGARRMRECIFRVLPRWYVEEAIDTCRATLERGVGNKPLAVRVAESIAEFEKIGISKARLEAKVGPADQWTAADIAQLRVSYRSIRSHEVTAEEEFPRVEQTPVEATKEAIKRQRKPKAEAKPVQDDAEVVPDYRDASHNGAGGEIFGDTSDEPALADDGFDDDEVPNYRDASHNGAGGEVFGGTSDQPGPAFHDLMQRIRAAESIQGLQKISLSNDSLRGLSEHEVDDLRGAWTRRLREIQGTAGSLIE